MRGGILKNNEARLAVHNATARTSIDFHDPGPNHAQFPTLNVVSDSYDASTFRLDDTPCALLIPDRQEISLSRGNSRTPRDRCNASLQRPNRAAVGANCKFQRPTIGNDAS